MRGRQAVPLQLRNYLANDWPGLWRRIGDLEALFDQRPRAVEARLGIVVNRAERFTGFHRLCNFFVQHDPDRRIHGIAFRLAAATQDHTRFADGFALDRSHISGLGARNIQLVLRLRQAARVVHHLHVPALQPDHLAKPIKRLAGADEFSAKSLALFHRIDPSSQVKHPSCQFQAQVAQVFRTSSAQN